MTFTSVRCTVFQDDECDFFEEGGVSPYCNLISVDITALVNARQSQAALQSTLSDRYGRDYEYLLLVEGMEEILDDPKQVLALGCHDRTDLSKLFDEVVCQGEQISHNDLARKFGFNFISGAPKQQPKFDLGFLDENKSDRRIRKERNRKRH